jgi:hypothetical protein
MKKNLLFITATALVFVGCANDSLRSDVQEEQTAIGFSTITNKQTRAENSDAAINGNLEAYNTTFKVWAYKEVNGTESPVLGAVEGANSTYTYPGQLVSHIDANANATPAITEHWEYTPVRFWDKSATLYKFYAASPSRDDWDWNNTTKKVSIDDFSISGYNSVTGTPATAVVANKVLTENLTTEDLMISTDITNHKTYTNAPVNLDFNHILSRLNIGVRKASTLDAFTVYLKSIKVYNMKSNGSFDEGTILNNGGENGAAQDVNGDNETNEADEAYLLSQGTVRRWSDASNPAKFTSGVGYTPNDALEITSTETTANTYYQYVYEGLAIPQSVAYSKTVLVNDDVTNITSYLYLNGSNADANSAPYIVIEYEIGKTENNVYTKHDSYKYYYNLADVFNGDATTSVDFCEGWQNTLKITLAPAAINFDADVYQWSTKVEQPVTIE